MTVNWRHFDIPLEQHPNYPSIMYHSRQFLIDPILGHYLFHHGINDYEKLTKFLTPSIKTDLYNPFLLNDMKKAVIRIIKAIRQKEKILIFGDYDVDGVTSTSILLLALKRFTADVSFRLPLRSEGYGLSAQAMEKVSDGTSLIITVDNGTSSHEAMRIAKARGIDVIVTDHHEILGMHPDCLAFINPMRHDNNYPFTSLSGAGVALKVVQALYQVACKDFDLPFFEYVELATLGTIADLMPIKDENRVICKIGLQKMNTSPLPVFKRIFDETSVKDVDSSTIGFTLGPIFNSCGRIDDPNTAVNILTGVTTTKQQISFLIGLNKKRKELTKQQALIADTLILQDQLYKDKVIVVFGDFHNGIIGIIASKIVEKYKKPSIVISKTGTGSARSVNGSGFSIVNVINTASMYLTKHGGHQAAAGLSIVPDINQVNLFRKAVQLAANEETFNQAVLTYVKPINICHFYDELFSDIDYLEPYGINFPKPLFYCPPGMLPTFNTFGKNKEHAKLRYNNKEAIAFFKGELVKGLDNSQKVHTLFSTFCNQKKNFLIHSLMVK
ncbi:single-stranded-DNA-specific exonuclease RecJ [Bacillus aerolatus]|uniref:Single-stranded-DNA-specific exonuclease RecJ n=1 Tax=Bacillus aerolatus TaxID=2653354 RepID=A0A6I1FHF3_9BACI|nr:single-stranded-DNA-specific exonuclease RecJ [Bacillus aerolatus]KAB7704907.1 single-stranded-DNA-specific exonuclease RecJ [Bacillus aerolatus]